MLYLAEVQKQKSGFGLGSGKAELKLLACQRGEHSWTAIPGSDTIPAEEANTFGAGTLVFVDLSPNKQIKGSVEEASTRLVSILQNFSRGQDKLKTKEEEIEQWMQSLTYQSQELQRREMELQAREEELTHLESQRQEIQSSSEESTKLREDLERKQQELDSAWEQLRSEKEQMQEQLDRAQQSVNLDEGLANHIQELLDYLSGTTAPTESIREPLNVLLERVERGQSIFNDHWQRLEQLRTDAQQQQQELDAKYQELQNLRQDYQQGEADLARDRSALKVLEETLAIRQEYASSLEIQLQNQEQLHQQLFQLADTSEQVTITDKVDVEALEKMSVEELQGLVQNLQQDLDKIFQFVNGQEEELKLQREMIQDLERQLSQANDSERWNIQRNLTDEQEAYQMLDQTLVGQRRNLRERQEILSQHQAVLNRRLGNNEGIAPGQQLALGPVLGQIEQVTQQQTEKLEKLKAELEGMQQNVEHSRQHVESKSGELEGKRGAIAQLEEQLVGLRSRCGELSGRVGLYEEMLQPLQDTFNELKQKLEEVAGFLGQTEETNGHQQDAIAQMRDILSGLIDGQSPELAAS